MPEDQIYPRETTDRKGILKHTVQFPDDVQNTDVPDRRPTQFSRFDSSTVTGESRAPSPAGMDDEDSVDDYDWSGEEDLVDEEAKFEQNIGVRNISESFGLGR